MPDLCRRISLIAFCLCCSGARRWSRPAMLPVRPVHGRRRLHHPLHQLHSRQTPQGVPCAPVKLLHCEYNKQTGAKITRRPQLNSKNTRPQLAQSTCYFWKWKNCLQRNFWTKKLLTILMKNSIPEVDLTFLLRIVAYVK